MAALRKKLDERSRAARGAAGRLRELAAEYARAVDHALAAELAGKCGLEGPHAQRSPEQIAAELLAIVSALPELGPNAPPNIESIPVEPPPAPRGAAPPSSDANAPPASFSELFAKSQPRHERPERQAAVQPAHPAVLELLRELQEHDLPALPTPMFRALAEELAARARELQQRGAADPDDKLGHVIRVLTRCAYDRGTTHIFGLNRHHEADWREKAEAARERRLRLQVGEPDSLRHRLRIPNALADPISEELGDDDEDEAGRPWDVPRLAARASRAAVVLFGGARKAAKLSSLRRRLGFDVEWIETASASTSSTAVLERRMRDGHVAAVVILEGLMGHKHYEPVIAAARQAGVPVAYGGRAGTASLEQALLEIELGLRRAADDTEVSSAD